MLIVRGSRLQRTSKNELLVDIHQPTYDDLLCCLIWDVISCFKLCTNDVQSSRTTVEGFSFLLLLIHPNVARARTREARAAQKRLYTKEDSNSQKDRQQTFSTEKKLEAFDYLIKYFLSLQLLNFKDKYGKTLLYENSIVCDYHGSNSCL